MWNPFKRKAEEAPKPTPTGELIIPGPSTEQMQIRGIAEQATVNAAQARKRALDAEENLALETRRADQAETFAQEVLEKAHAEKRSKLETQRRAEHLKADLRAERETCEKLRQSRDGEVVEARLKRKFRKVMSGSMTPRSLASVVRAVFGG